MSSDPFDLSTLDELQAEQLAAERRLAMSNIVGEFAPRRSFGGLSAVELAARTFEPLQYVVPGILTAGLTLFAGPPKIGKSYAAMGMGIAASSGGYAFGSIKCEEGDVLYCALEDGERRLHERLHKMVLEGDPMPGRLFFETTAKRIGEGLEEDLANWLDSHPEARLVILDTWRCIKPLSSGRGSAYDEDANGLHPIHEISKAYPRVAFVVIHHTRKADAEDIFDTISGTNGLTGVADTLMVLARHGEGWKLCARSRDFEGYEKALHRDSLTGGWIVVGDALELAKTSERQEILDVLREAEGEPVTLAAIASATGKRKDNTAHLLKRLVNEGLVEKAGYGKYRAIGQSNYSERSISGGAYAED